MHSSTPTGAQDNNGVVTALHAFVPGKSILQRILTTPLLIAVVGTVVVPVTHPARRYAVAVVTSELSRRASGSWCVAHVLQLIGLVPAVIVSIAYEVAGYAAAILAGELVLLAGLVGAAPLIAAVAAVVASVAPDF